MFLYLIRNLYLEQNPITKKAQLLEIYLSGISQKFESEVLEFHNTCLRCIINCVIRVDEMAKMLEEERLNYEEENQLSEGLLVPTRGSPRRRRSFNADGDGDKARSRSRSPVTTPKVCFQISTK